ncbi:MAG: S41 family peptidase [Paludibacter sp.]|jgi:carboxyl-terminal processing protease|nr:S41 family peptidase [Paludibacter sp.]
MKRNNYILVISIFFAIIFGFVIGNTLSSRNNNVLQKHNIYQNTKSNNNNVNIKSLKEMFDLIDEYYVDSVNINEINEDLLYEIAANLDPHTVYIPASDLQNVNSELVGSFGGIGIQFNIQNDTVMVIQVISGGPSEKAGVLPGDRIITVNDTAFTGKEVNNEKVMKKLRGQLDTKVVIGVKRQGSAEELKYSITRGVIPVNSVDVAYMITDKTGFIKINTFGENTYKEFLNALAELRSKGAKSYIIDLRENGGGLMDVAIAMVNEFLPKDRMIVYSKGRSYRRAEAKADGSGSCIGIPVAVLIDEFSASASEIFAGAIQDNDCGTIIGRRSFGKGLVQQQFDLSNGAAVRLTVAKYYTPSGRCIQKPYTIGDNDNYEQDIFNRYTHGEFDSADSIHFADTVVYKTFNGRTVYSGGGIMPDVFVALDTANVTPYFNNVYNKAYLYQFSFAYTDKNRAALQNYKDWKALSKYLDSQNLLSDFVAFANNKGIAANNKEIATSQKLILQHIKSYIIRNMLGDIGFYPALFQDNKTVKKALEAIENQK